MTTVVDITSALRNADARVNFFGFVEEASKLDGKASQLFVQKNWGDLLDRLRGLRVEETTRLRQYISTDDLVRVNRLIDSIRDEIAKPTNRDDTQLVELMDEELGELLDELKFIDTRTATLAKIARAISALELFEVPGH